jgi:integrase
MLATESGRYGSLILLLGLGGLRWGEAAAQRVSDVDFLKRRVHLHRNAVAVGGQVITGTLKTGTARTVALPPQVVDALSVTCRGKNRDDLLWSTAAGNPLMPPAPSSSWLAFAVRRCQAADPEFPRLSAHALRHTAASLAISAGANVKAVQRMLGHSSAAMTLDVYADLFEDDLDAVAANVGKMWASVASSN